VGNRAAKAVSEAQEAKVKTAVTETMNNQRAAGERVGPAVRAVPAEKAATAGLPSM
jgi:hypothetical protein